MEETREDWRSGSFNWTGSALLPMLQCSVQVLECERSEVYELSLGTWSSFGAVHCPVLQAPQTAGVLVECVALVPPLPGGVAWRPRAQKQRLSSQHGARAWIRSLSRGERDMDGRGTWLYKMEPEPGALPGSERRLWLWRWPLLEGGGPPQWFSRVCSKALI